MTDLSNAGLPSVEGARLPATYEAAKVALSECQGIDECKDWADKAEALASYAKQSQDDQLERMAQRIRARAIRRAGELIKQIEPAANHHGNSSEVVGHPTSRKGAARDAGMSEHQQKTAVRVANVSEADFETQVEGDKPPTLSALASQGTKRREPPSPETWLKGRDPKDFNAALHFAQGLKMIAEDMRKLNPDRAIPHLDDRHREIARKAIAEIDKITDTIATRI